MVAKSTEVVTAFLRNRSEVLLVRRSKKVGTYRGRWGGISGYVEPGDEAHAAPGNEDAEGPEAAVRREIDEETGLLEICTLVRWGEPFLVEDETIDRVWTVHPFLFDCADRAVEPNAELAQIEWVSPTEIFRLETVPALWTSYDRVRPTVATIRADDEHGSAYLSVRALEVLRDRAGELAAGIDGPSVDASTELATLAEELIEARPGMAALAARIDWILATADGRTPDAVEEHAIAGIERARDADAGAATVAAEYVTDGRVLTLSRSGTALNTLRQTSVEVVVAESRPGGEGVGIAETLAATGRDVTLIPDAAVAHRLAAGKIDAVLVGADTVLAGGHVVNKIGTRAVALSAPGRWHLRSPVRGFPSTSQLPAIRSPRRRSSAGSSPIRARSTLAMPTWRSRPRCST